MGGESPNQVTRPAGAVFVSYASQDAEAAKRICETLRAAGIEVWFDQSELRGGEAWDRQIRKQIHDCALFIPVISANAHARVEGYFRLEWKLAIDRSHFMAPDQTFLLPVVIDTTPQTDERIPDRFRELQWSRLSAGQASPAFIKYVQQLLSPELAHAPTVIQGATGRASSMPTTGDSGWASWRLKPALLATVAVVIAVALGSLVADKFWFSKRTASSTLSTRTVTERSIAVLPFADMSEKHDQEYFADGLSEGILNLLAGMPTLNVIGRTSSFQFK